MTLKNIFRRVVCAAPAATYLAPIACVALAPAAEWPDDRQTVSLPELAAYETEGEHGGFTADVSITFDPMVMAGSGSASIFVSTSHGRSTVY
jgi:hypothetical protein